MSGDFDSIMDEFHYPGRTQYKKQAYSSDEILVSSVISLTTQQPFPKYDTPSPLPKSRKTESKNNMFSGTRNKHGLYKWQY